MTPRDTSIHGWIRDTCHTVAWLALGCIIGTAPRCADVIAADGAARQAGVGGVRHGDVIVSGVCVEVAQRPAPQSVHDAAL